MCIIECLEYNTTKKEFKKYLINLIFKKAKNKDEAKNNKNSKKKIKNIKKNKNKN